MAIALRSLPRGCIFHSDCSKGNCHDNAAVLLWQNSPLGCFLIFTTFFKTIKAELM